MSSSDKHDNPPLAFLERAARGSVRVVDIVRTRRLHATGKRAKEKQETKENKQRETEKKKEKNDTQTTTKNTKGQKRKRERPRKETHMEKRKKTKTHKFPKRHQGTNTNAQRGNKR